MDGDAMEWSVLCCHAQPGRPTAHRAPPADLHRTRRGKEKQMQNALQQDELLIDPRVT